MTGDQTSSEALVARCARGDVGALGELYDRVATTAYALARRITRTNALAERAVEAAFLDALRGAAGYDASHGSAESWVIRLVHRRAVAAAREAGPRWDEGDTAPPRLAPGAARPSEAVQAALARLPQEQRLVLELAYLQGRTVDEIAQLLGETVASVRARAHAALGSVRDLVGAVSR